MQRELAVGIGGLVLQLMQKYTFIFASLHHKSSLRISSIEPFPKSFGRSCSFEAIKDNLCSST